MGVETFDLKKISPDGVAHSLEKANRYRLLNEPEQAESLCLDVLEIEPGRQDALIMVILALTDQFSNEGSGRTIRRANKYVAEVSDSYQKLYYTGIVHEREGRAMLKRTIARESAYECFRDAMHFYEKATEVKPDNNDDAIQRWNSCARTIMKEKLCAADKPEAYLLE